MNGAPIGSDVSSLAKHGNGNLVHLCFACLFWLLPGLVTAQTLIPARTFTNTEGRKIEAEVLWVKDGNVALKKLDGQTYEYPLGKLCPEDRQFLRPYAGKTSAMTATALWNPQKSSVLTSWDSLKSHFHSAAKLMLFLAGLFLVICASLAITVAYFQDGAGAARFLMPFAFYTFVVRNWQEVKTLFYWKLLGYLMIFLAIFG